MEWSISTVSGGKFCKALPLFLEKSIVVSKGTTIAALSLTTHEANYLLIDHKREITSYILDLNNLNYLFSSSLDGTIRQWNIKEEKCIQIFEINSPIHKICSDYSDTDYLYILIENNTPSKSPRKWSVIHYNLKTKNADEVILSVEGPKPFISTKQYTDNFSNSNTEKQQTKKRIYEEIVTILVISHENIISIYNSNTKKLINHSHNFTITTQCFHPIEDYIAIGDRTGKITLYHNLLELTNTITTTDTSSSSINNNNNNNYNKILIPSIYHWHSSRVNTITFTPDGLLMLTGGVEGVLVIWQLSTNTKTYLPRLGSTILKLTASNTQIIMCLSDNSVRLFNIINMNLIWNIKGFALSQNVSSNHISSMLSAGFIGCNDLLLTAQYNGFIQFYDPLKDKSIYELNIIKKNPITQTGTSQYGIEIVKFAVNQNRHLLITVERFAKGTIMESYTLKFWILKNESFQYILNSMIENPHNNGIINSLYVHPFLDIVVTGDNNGEFRIWKPMEVHYDDLHSYNLSPYKWRCINAGEYNNYKIQYITLSTDGSILVLVTDNIITLWNTETVTLLKTIPFEMRKTIRSVSNLNNTEYFIVQLNSSIEIYSYLTGLPYLILPVNSSVLKVDNMTKGQFGFISNDAKQSNFILYDIYSNNLECIIKTPNNILTFSFIYINNETNVLFLSGNNELLLLSQTIQTSPDSLLSEEILVNPPLPTPYEQAFGITAIDRLKNELKKQENNDARKFKNLKGKELKDYINAPSHLLPLPSVIGEVFFDGLLKPTTGKRDGNEEIQATPYSKPKTIKLK